jgi:hypothetical protein
VLFDGTIIDWADALDPSWLAADHTYYSGALKARTDKAALAVGDSPVQSPDPPSRPGPLHADPGRG